MGRLDGKVALITGAARGMGAAEARLFVSEGARVLIADMLEDDGRALAAELGDAARFQRLDVSQEEQWAQAVAAAEAMGPLNVLVNNAGILRAAAIEDMTLEQYMSVIMINQVGTFLGMRAAAPAMKRAGGGSIVNISTVASLIGIRGLSAYAASKGGLDALTRSVAVDYGQDNIRCNAVNPGLVDTPMAAPLMADPASLEPIMAQYAIRRPGKPEEVAKMVLYLASDEAMWVTGQTFPIDGGMTISKG